MTTTLSRPWTREGRRDRLRIGLGLLEAFVGANAVWGGLVLMTDGWQLPTDWLRHSPFDDWFLPGLALIGWIVVQLAWLRIVHPVMQPRCSPPAARSPCWPPACHAPAGRNAGGGSGTIGGTSVVIGLC